MTTTKLSIEQLMKMAQAPSPQQSSNDPGVENNTYYVNKTALIALLEKMKQSAANNKNPLLQVAVKNIVSQANVELKKGGGAGVSTNVDEHKTSAAFNGDIATTTFDAFTTQALTEEANSALFQAGFSGNSNARFLTGKDMSTQAAFMDWLTKNGFVDEKQKKFDDKEANICFATGNLHRRAMQYKSIAAGLPGDKLKGLAAKYLELTTALTKLYPMCAIADTKPRAGADQSTSGTSGANSPSSGDSSGGSSGAPTDAQKIEVNRILNIIASTFPRDIASDTIPISEVKKFFDTLSSLPAFTQEKYPAMAKYLTDVGNILNRIIAVFDEPILFLRNSSASIIKSKCQTPAGVDQLFRGVQALANLIPAIMSELVRYGELYDPSHTVHANLRRFSTTAQYWTSNSYGTISPSMVRFV